MKHLLRFFALLMWLLPLSASATQLDNNPQLVDLGLPSGTLWADRNLGSNAPTQPGLYYTWGETEGVTAGPFKNNKYISRHNERDNDGDMYECWNISKYLLVTDEELVSGTVDGLSQLQTEDDAAIASWGNDWTMPSREQFKELLQYCTITRSTEDNSYVFTGPNGNSIKMPWKSYYIDGIVSETATGYWSKDLDNNTASTISSSNAACLFVECNNWNVNVTDHYRGQGFHIRPVSTTKAVNTDYTLTNGGTTITINPGASIDDVKTSLGDKCSDITELYITGNYPNKASIDALKTNYFPNLEKVHLTLETTETSIGASAYYGCTLLSSIIIPSSVKSIGNNVFTNCSGLTSVTIPSSVTSIGSSAFSDCSSLTSIVIPSSVISIGSDAFMRCSGLSKAEFESIESLCNISFGGLYGNPLSYAHHLYINGIEKTDVVIPSSITSIKQYTFSGCSSLTSIDIPSSVTSIGEYAFYNCSGLTSIDIPSSVTSIGQYAFGGCSGLTSINIPSSVTSIKQYTFSGCSSLTSINIPSSVTSIGQCAFSGCSSLTSINIPSSVTSIGQYAFSGCSKLESMTLPFVGESATATTASSSTHFGYIFGTSSYTGSYAVQPSGYSISYYLPSSLKEVTITSRPLLYGAFYNCAKLNNINLGNGVTAIGNYALYNCTGLKTLTIPASVTSIGSFGINTNSEVLGVITMLPTTPPTLSSSNGVHTLPVIYVPAASYDAYTTATNWSAHQGQMIPMGTKTDWAVTTTADANMSSLHALIGEPNLDKVVSLKVTGTINSYDLMIMRNKMINLRYLDLEDASIVANSYEYYAGYCSKDDEIDQYAISKNILTLKLPNTLKTIKASAFSDCSNTYEITIPNSVETIGVNAFRNCSALTNVIVPNSVKNIGEGAFNGCRNMRSITVPFIGTNPGPNWSGNTSQFASIFGRSFSGGYAVTYDNSIDANKYYLPNTLEEVTITIGDNLSSDISNAIPGRAFAGCTSLTKITIPENTSYIGYDAFYNCHIYRIGIPNTVTRICNGAFKGSYVQSITIPSTINTIERETFSSCRINSIDIPNSVTTIENDAFKNSSLKEVTIPNSVVSIGNYAFSGCKFTDITIPNSVTSIGQYAFSSCTSMKSCVLPRNSVVAEIPQYAFSGCTSLEKMQLPVSVKTIGNYAFQNCTNMTEMKIPSGITSIGNYAFTGCTKLDNVYTYTIEPQPIDQNTFAAVTYTDALLHVPAVSYYNYYYDTKWSQFLHLTNFDEPYDYVYLQNDFTLRTETAGIISGKPETEIESTGGLIVTGNVEQPLGDVHIKFDVTTNQGASIIAQNNLTADNLYIDVNVKKDFWHFFCFPFDVDLTKIKKDGSYIFRRYDSSMRAANGTGGWRDVEGTTLAAGKGYIFRTNTAGTLSIPVAAPNLSGAKKTTVLVKYGDESTPDENKNWNFVGNTYLSYYDTNSMTYDAPIVVWDGTTYVAYRPGDDDYTLTPFQAFFVQSPNNVADVTFDPDGRMTRIQMETGNATAAKSRARKAARLAKDRQLIDLSISDGENTDKCRVVFNDNQSLNYEMECDAAKFLSSEKVPQIYTIDDNGTQYAINERPMLGGMVYIGFVAPHDGEYTFAASRMDMPVYVVDNLTGKTINLAEGYTFTAEEGTDNTRFAITTKPGSDVDAIETVNADMLNNTNAVIYDLTGKRVEKAHHGVYIVDGVKVFVK